MSEHQIGEEPKRRFPRRQMSKLMTQAEHDARYAVPDAATRTIMRPEDIAAADAGSSDIKPNCRDVAGNALIYLRDARDGLLVIAGERPHEVTEKEAPNGNLHEVRQQLDDILKLSDDIVHLVTEVQMQI